MFKNYNIELFATTVLLVCSLFVSVSVQNLIGGILIASLGILHGANDIAIIQQQTKHSKTFPTIFMYIGVVLFGGIAFFFIPALALLSFVLVSAYHFGEQHLANRCGASPYNPIYFFVYGSLVFALLFFFHQQQVQEVVQMISMVAIPDEFFAFLLVLAASFFLLFSLFRSEWRKGLIYELSILLVVACVFASGSLLYAFGFYFVVWHSFPSLKSQMNFLYKSETFSMQFEQYLRSSVWYWIAALLGLTAGYFWIDFSAQYFLPLFFTFLAAITFPHVVVMQQMFQSKKQCSVVGQQK